MDFGSFQWRPWFQYPQLLFPAVKRKIRPPNMAERPIHSIYFSRETNQRLAYLLHLATTPRPSPLSVCWHVRFLMRCLENNQVHGSSRNVLQIFFYCKERFIYRKKRFIYGSEQSERLVEKPSRCPTLWKWFENAFLRTIWIITSSSAFLSCSLLASRFKGLSSPNVCRTNLARDRSSDRRNRIILPSLFVHDMRGRNIEIRQLAVQIIVPWISRDPYLFGAPANLKGKYWNSLCC